MGLFNMGVGADKRWYYPISGTVFRTLLTVSGIWSIWYPFIQDAFNIDVLGPITVGASALSIGAMVIGPPIAGTLLDWLDSPKVPLGLASLLFLGGFVLIGVMFATDDWATARWTWYAGSFLVGTGGGMAQGAANPTVSRWFRGERLGRAMAIGNLGGSLARLVLAPFATFLVAVLGFGADVFLAMGATGAVATAVLGFALWRNPTQEEIESGKLEVESGDESDEGRDEPEPEAEPESDIDQGEYHILEAVKTAKFWVLFIAMFFAAAAYMGFLQNIATILIDGLSQTGHNPDQVSSDVVPTFFMISGVVGIGGALGWGELMDRLGSPWRALRLNYLFSIIIFVVFYFTYSNLMMVYVVGAILFLITPGQPILHFASVPALFGRKNVGMIMSYINAFSVGAGLAIGPVLFGYMADFFGGYGEALLVAAAMFVGSFLAAVYGLRLERRE